MSSSVRSVVIPAAGLGTRFLPATKAQPKEMITLVDRPLIQYAVEEATAAGAQNVVLVSGPGKSSMEEHFRPSPGLESRLQEKGRDEDVRTLRRFARLASVSTVLQQEPLGVGHAVLMAREAVGASPFAVMFPDDLIVAQVSALEQLRRVHDRTGGNVIAVQQIPPEQVGRYGIVDGQPAGEGIFEVKEMVEKPSFDEAPSDLAIVGRYILVPEIFDVLANTRPGAGSEIQLTDAIHATLGKFPCHAVAFEGKRFDCGSKLGYLQATVELARRHPELGPAFCAYIEELTGR